MNEPDVLIVGGGPVGLTLARELSHVGLHVKLLETGPWTAPALPSDDIELSGFALSPQPGSRVAGVGGLAHQWSTSLRGGNPSARLAQLAPSDFQDHNLRPKTRWPFDFSSLEPFYRRAYEVCGIGHSSLEAALSLEAQRGTFALEGLHPSLGAFVGAKRFIHDIPAELTRRRRLEMKTETHVSRLVSTPEGDRVVGVETIQAGGEKRVHAARVVILAAGAIGNARILLASEARKCMPLGHHFSTHYRLAAGTFRIKDESLLPRLGRHDFWEIDGRTFESRLRFKHDVTQRHGALNASVTFVPELAHRQVMLSPLLPIAAAGAGVLAVRQRSLHPKFGHGYWSRVPWLQKIAPRVRATVQMEQVPQSDNQARAGSSSDHRGLARMRVINRLGKDDYSNIAAMFGMLDEAIARNPSLESDRPASNDRLQQAIASIRPMGHDSCTTIAGMDAETSVVDKDLKVHGIQNVYCAGSSVFATVGEANPLLTALALAIRLADRVAQELRASERPVEDH